MPRPEVFYNEEILKKHGMSDPGCVYHLEQVLAPGDVIVPILESALSCCVHQGAQDMSSRVSSQATEGLIERGENG